MDCGNATIHKVEKKNPDKLKACKVIDMNEKKINVLQ